MANVKTQYFRKALAVCGDHFPGTELYGLAVGQIKVERPFQAKPFAEGGSAAGFPGMKFADASRPRDRGCHCGGSDFRAARAFGHLKEHGAAAEIESARTFIKAKNRVRS